MSILFFFTLDEKSSTIIIGDNVKDDNYVPRHANSDDVIHNWNEDFMNRNDINNNGNYTSNNILDNLDDIDYFKRYDLDDNSTYNNNVDSELNNKKKKKKKRKKNTGFIWKVLLVLFIVIIIGSSLKIILWLIDNKRTSNNIDDISSTTDIIFREDNENTELINKDDDKNSDYWYYIKFPLIDVDINKLKSKNSDTVGWVNVNNTNINYPYVQRDDNVFYLDHSYDKKYNEAGWVFLDYRNNKDLSDRNNILYAHSRLDKTMFGSLSKTLHSSWFTNLDNHIIRISTEKDNTLWQIFSVYKIKEESYYITTDFNSDTEYAKFLDTIKNRSIYDFNTNVLVTDRVLTLSTCYSDTERTVVHAKLIKRSKN